MEDRKIKRELLQLEELERRSVRLVEPSPVLARQIKERREALLSELKTNKGTKHETARSGS